MVRAMSNPTTDKTKRGRPPKPPTKQRHVVPVRLPKDLLEALDERRGAQSRNAFIEEAIRGKLGGAFKRRVVGNLPASAEQLYTCPQHPGVNRGRCTTVGCTATQRPVR